MKLPKITCLTIKTSITYSKQAKVDSEAVTRRCPVPELMLEACDLIDSSNISVYPFKANYLFLVFLKTFYH